MLDHHDHAWTRACFHFFKYRFEPGLVRPNAKIDWSLTPIGEVLRQHAAQFELNIVHIRVNERAQKDTARAVERIDIRHDFCIFANQTALGVIETFHLLQERRHDLMLQTLNGDGIGIFDPPPSDGAALGSSISLKSQTRWRE